VKLSKDFPQPFRRARLEFDMIAPLGFTHNEVVSFNFDSGDAVSFGFRPTEVYADDIRQTVVFGAPVPRTGAWFHVTLILQFADSASGAPGFLRLSFGDPDAGAPYWDRPITWSATGLALDLGATYVDGSPDGWSANFDNVVLRLDPP
jgi:hypothetical protein